MKTKALLLMLFFSTFVLALNAQAEVIDFESLAHSGDESAGQGATYTEDGFLLTNTATVASSGFEPSLATVGTGHDGYSGSTALFNDNWAGETVLTRTDGGWFNLYTIALSELYDSANDPISVVFTGVSNSGATVMQTLILDGAFGAQVFTFDTNFSNLVSVSWLQTDVFHQFDDITVAPVPEPTTILLFASGLLTVAAARRKRG
jgi:hypothetical protein